MSKQSEAKEQQGYVAKPVVRRCGVCVHFKFDVKKGDYGPIYSKLRCGIGGFAVKKNGICDLFKIVY